jgi:hypothetical protein
MTRLSILLAALALTVACAKTPPDLTPEASVAFKATQAVRALDILRDTAIAAHAQTPPLMPEATTRKVVLYHQSTIKVIQAAPSGWRAVTQTGLDELAGNLSPSDKALLAPYIALVKAVIAEVK